MNLHLGCGERFIEGFIHVDLKDFPHVDRVGRIENLDWVEDETVGLIYASHVLEHFSRHETKNVLKEWHRVLKNRGILRLAVPDFEAICKVYTWDNSIDVVKGLVCGGQDYENNTHRNIFDFESLKEILFRVGFTEVDKYDWWNTEHAGVDDFSQAYIPHMNTTGTLMSLNVEATR